MPIFILKRVDEKMLQVKNLFCNYNDVNVIKNISFDLEENIHLCIIGPNGCGKTTLLKSIANLIPYKGQVIINGKDMINMSRGDISRNIALMNQISEVYFPYSVFETVSLGRYVHSKGWFKEISSDDRDFILKCIESVGLIDKKDKMINELSGGQLQRVFLARAFAQDPSILLLDEPTNHLDLKSQIELLEYINVWKEEKNRSVIGVIHDLNLVQNFAQKVLIMNHGEIILRGTPKKVFNSSKISDVYGLDVKNFMINTLEKWK